MHLRVTAPGIDLKQSDVDRIEKDLEKIDRRLGDREVYAEIRITRPTSNPLFHATLEVEYGPTHLIAKTEHEDIGQAVRGVREEVLRQINDRSPRGHSDFSKRR